jgi:hypothetical protein
MSRPDRRLLMPRDAGRYAGPRAAVWFLAIYTVVATARSLVHILAPDSGAGSIAGIDTAGAGGANAIALLAQWGGAQLIMALTAWVVLWRYRGLVPLMIAAAMLDNVLRILIGLEKPISTAGTPPGALSWVVAPLCAVFLVIALMPRADTRSGEEPAPGA